jgi:ubiquinone/menaquinone biosynthesis C-methylase UbiE
VGVLDEHQHYVSDEARVSAFRQALREVIKPSHVVLDFASGTGILGMLACEAGAARVYSVEHTSLVGVSRQIAQVNGFQDRIKFIKGFTTAIELPERVDVIVADQIGFFGQSTGVVQEFLDASRRFLKPSGVLIPNRIDLGVAPIELADIAECIDFWSSSSLGLDFSPMRALAVNNSYPRQLSAKHLLAEPHAGPSLHLPTSGESTLRIETEFSIHRDGTLNGIAGWFSAQLSATVSMTNSPVCPKRINRPVMVFPMGRAVPVSIGDRVRLKMILRPADHSVSWTVEVWGSDGVEPRATFRHSTAKGLLLCREDLVRTHPNHVPRMNGWGKAHAYAVSLCDGIRTLREIEEELWGHFPEIFTNRSDAASFVAALLDKYSSERG